MLHRIRDAMQTGSFAKASRRVEVDETFIGGKARNMHEHIRERKITGTGGKDKTAVMGILERGGKVRTKVVANRKKALLQAIVKTTASSTSIKGHAHTNGMENFWCLLKRSLKGSYVSVAAYHLFRYVDEQAFRYNERDDERSDLGRFRRVVRGYAGRRLTYRELTGKEDGGKTAHDHCTHNRT